MTWKEAILKVLESEKKLFSPSEMHKKFEKNPKDYPLGDKMKAKRTEATIHVRAGSFIRRNDIRVKRIQIDKNWRYYNTKHRDEIKELSTIAIPLPKVKGEKRKEYQERDLHKLLSSYLKYGDVYSKTIYHERSKTGSDRNQKWLHPDMVGVKFLNTLKGKEAKDLMQHISKKDTFHLISYELKKKINTDYELKESFFQAFSNSRWANYGYLVALEINDDLKDEMKRLSQSFGIGIIHLKADPFKSEELYPSKYEELDFKTIDKICNVNKDLKSLFTLQMKY